MAGLRLRSPLLPLLLCSLCAGLGLLALQPSAFAGAAPSVGLRGARVPRTSAAAVPEPTAELGAAAVPDASAVLLADNTDAIPLVAFLV
eukprot:CAMPEP_0179049884 /NCGR_PEP_ID=MMETSP0796-20121207/20443_1 /TAXON_ID=73915 /ORGANISM="Pyrodinium bahamense, Strain pbaha01" /LENGTH=88 /DNA_ID=CAMNT_0020746375 /DNA_START=26 /DNA_END=288 /DNA_ORIENTATION=-